VSRLNVANRRPRNQHAFLAHEVQVVLTGPLLGEQPAGVVVVVRVEVGEVDRVRSALDGQEDVVAQATMQVWLDAITSAVPAKDIRAVLDVGCGTGRFAPALADAFRSGVIGLDPSDTMLAAARNRVDDPRVCILKGDAEHLPVTDGSACLVFLSMVYHHIADRAAAAREFRRALRVRGFLCVRNATRDHIDRCPYLQYFPSAIGINRRRLPAGRELVDTLESHGFSLRNHAVIEQEFAASPQGYYHKISRRGLSDLAVLSDAEFEAGILERLAGPAHLGGWDRQPTFAVRERAEYLQGTAEGGADDV
jgi:ubiquinone/menaquinone biosynthesis C-methylase UbiE